VNARRGVSESIGLGQSLSREPSRREGAWIRARARLQTRPLTRGNSTPWSPDCPAHAGMDGGKSTDRREHERGAQATHRTQDGYRRSAGRACGSIRWQKSTDDARPRAPRREERPEAAGSSSTSPHRVRKSERASEAGPGSAKPFGIGDRFTSEARRASVGSSEHPSMEGARCAPTPMFLDGNAGAFAPAAYRHFPSWGCRRRREKSARGSWALPASGRKRRTFGGVNRGVLDRGPAGSVRTRPSRSPSQEGLVET